MKIQFDIKEKMPEIIAEILHSDKWQAVVEVDNFNLKKVIIKDPLLNSKIFVEIWEKEVHIKTPRAAHTYRIFHKGSKSVCEYIGKRNEVLLQRPLPQITPLKNIQCTYEDECCNESTGDICHNFYQCKVNDDYIKDGMPMPAIVK